MQPGSVLDGSARALAVLLLGSEPVRVQRPDAHGECFSAAAPGCGAYGSADSEREPHSQARAELFAYSRSDLVAKRAPSRVHDS